MLAGDIFHHHGQVRTAAPQKGSLSSPNPRHAVMCSQNFPALSPPPCSSAPPGAVGAAALLSSLSAGDGGASWVGFPWVALSLQEEFEDELFRDEGDPLTVTLSGGPSSWLGRSSVLHSFIGSPTHQTHAECPPCAPSNPRTVQGGRRGQGCLPGAEHVSPGQTGLDADHASACWNSAVSLSTFSHLLRGKMVRAISELLRFLYILASLTAPTHPHHPPRRTILEPSEPAHPSWRTWPGLHKDSAAQSRHPGHGPFPPWPASYSAFPPPLQEGWASVPWPVSWLPPDVAPPSWVWQNTPPPPPPLLGLSSDPAAPGSSPGVLRGCVLPGPPWPSAKRNQKIRAQGLSLGCSHSGPSLERGPSSLKQCRTREGEQGLLCASQGSQQPRESNFRGTEKLALPKIAPLPAHWCLKLLPQKTTCFIPQLEVSL